MDKIIIIAGKTEKHEGLINCLNDLFPECEIEVMAKEYNKSESIQIGSESEADTEERLSKYLSFL